MNARNLAPRLSWSALNGWLDAAEQYKREELMIAILAELPPYLTPSPGVLAVSTNLTVVNIVAAAVIVLAAVAAAIALRK